MGSFNTAEHVVRFGDGEEESVAWLVRRFTPLLEAQARMDLGDRDLFSYSVSDLVNETWARALGKMRELDLEEGNSAARFSRYLSAILGNLVIELKRRALRARMRGMVDAESTVTFSEVPNSVTSALCRAEREEDVARIKACLSRIDEKQRDVFILRTLKGRSNQETAELLGISTNLAAQRFLRAREALVRCHGLFDELAGATGA